MHVELSWHVLSLLSIILQEYLKKIVDHYMLQYNNVIIQM